MISVLGDESDSFVRKKSRKDRSRASFCSEIVDL